jgi:hypothetical protein
MRAYVLGLAMILGGLVLQPALADPGGGHDDQRQHGARNNRMSPGEAAKIAQKRHGGGRVLAVEPADNGYRVKLLQHGDVNVVFIPAE